MPFPTYVPPYISSTDLAVYVRFLSLVSTYDWENDPLILNFNSELSGTQTRPKFFKCSLDEATFLSPLRESDLRRPFRVFQDPRLSPSRGDPDLTRAGSGAGVALLDLVQPPFGYGASQTAAAG